MILSFLIVNCLLQACESQVISAFKLRQWFEELNQEYVKQNSIAADLAWQSSIDPSNQELPGKAAAYQRRHIKWQHRVCDQLSTLWRSRLLNDTQRRQTYLLCRGPKFTFTEAREMSLLYEEVQSIYTDSNVCIPASTTVSNNNMTAVESAIMDYLSTVNEYFVDSMNRTIDSIPYSAKVASQIVYDEAKNMLCLSGEPDLEKIMSFSRNEKVLRWAWFVWREKVGPVMKLPYMKLIAIENVAARRNGYRNIGAAWRDEIEIPHLRQFCRELYLQIESLYKMLHGVVRFYLRKYYGDLVPAEGLIPAHLLGDLWSQNWESLADLVTPFTIDLDSSIKKANWTVLDIVKHAEDFYQSLGLPPMSDNFWKNSVLKARRGSRAHGAAADMFHDHDFRLLYGSGTTAKDMYVVFHEMGHIQYYMAYENQPGIFRQGANSAFHESIGDAVMYGVLTPQHLYRIGLINDTLLFHGNERVNKGKKIRKGITDNDTNDIEGIGEQVTFTFNDIFLLKQALNKIPQIPFSLLVDEYRWKLFEGSINEEEINGEFWKIASKLQGIAPPNQRSKRYFDAGAKFHVPDNTPYIRYYLSSYLQMQLFESMCKAAVFGRRDAGALPDSISLHNCDIYGAKTAGKILKDIMSKGSSVPWQESLRASTGSSVITASPLIRYYAPLTKLLTKLIRAYRIPIGW